MTAELNAPVSLRRSNETQDGSESFDITSAHVLNDLLSLTERERQRLVVLLDALFGAENSEPTDAAANVDRHIRLRQMLVSGGVMPNDDFSEHLGDLIAAAAQIGKGLEMASVQSRQEVLSAAVFQICLADLQASDAPNQEASAAFLSQMPLQLMQMSNPEQRMNLALLGAFGDMKIDSKVFMAACVVRYPQADRNKLGQAYMLFLTRYLELHNTNRTTPVGNGPNLRQDLEDGVGMDNLMAAKVHLLLGGEEAQSAYLRTMAAASVFTGAPLSPTERASYSFVPDDGHPTIFFWTGAIDGSQATGSTFDEGQDGNND